MMSTARAPRSKRPSAEWPSQNVSGSSTAPRICFPVSSIRSRTPPARRSTTSRALSEAAAPLIAEVRLARLARLVGQELRCALVASHPQRQPMNTARTDGEMFDRRLGRCLVPDLQLVLARRNAFDVESPTCLGFGVIGVSTTKTNPNIDAWMLQRSCTAPGCRNVSVYVAPCL